jgi:hypothetical protein
MSSLRPVGRSVAASKNDRKSLCRFTFADGRQYRTSRSPDHPHFCSDHARKGGASPASHKWQTLLESTLTACPQVLILKHLHER